MMNILKNTVKNIDKISRERVRQIENRAFEKVQKAMLENIKTKPFITH